MEFDTMAKFCIIALMIAAGSFAANTITLSKDSLGIFNDFIGDNFFGGMPIFPNYIRGALQLYFNNNQIVSFGIESTTRRTTSIRKAIPSLRHDAALTNGKSHYSLVNGRILPGNIADLNRKSVRNAQYKLEVKK